VSNEAIENPLNDFENEIKQLQMQLLEAVSQLETDEDKAAALEHIAIHRRHVEQLEQIIKNGD